MLPSASSYAELCSRFRWEIPEFYNIGVDVCDRWAAAEPDRLALTDVREDGDRHFTYGDLRALSNQTANLLRAEGVAQGDRVGILLPQTPETAYSHIAAYKLGAIAIPLFTLFGAEALQHRLANSGAVAVITDTKGAARIAGLRDALPALKLVLNIDGASEGALAFHALRAAQSAEFEPVDTRADDPAVIIYTSGTTGLPKGALHAHRVLLGHLPGVEMSHDLLPQPGDRIWTPADWAWIGGLLDVLMPALHHGVPVIARRFEKFTGEAAFELIRKYGVRNAFLPPTALKMMRAASDPARGRQVEMRSVASGGETLGAELLDWGRKVLGVTINEFYGQTECNMIVSSCAAIMPAVPGVMGQPVPGHELEVIDAGGRPLGQGETGMIAVRRPDPVMFLGYWASEEATRQKFIGDWLVTGDQGAREADGRIRFVGRDDDIINSAGYRIGPGEIEDCLMRHPAVEMAAAVGKPDAARGEIVKAYVVLRGGFAPGEELARELAEHVKSRLAAHEYPREVAFIDALPLTTTGKVVRRELRARARASIQTEATAGVWKIDAKQKS
jgi:acetyl-CoA synthetase